MFAQPHWKVQQPDPKERGNERARHEAYGVNPTSSSNKDSDSKQQQSLEKTKTTKNKQKKAQNKQEQAHKQEPVCWAATSEICFTKQLSRGLFWYPDDESLTKDLTIGWRVLACILISLLAIGLRVAHFACSLRGQQGLHYALLSSCVMCKLLSPRTLISIVSGFNVSLPFSSFSGNFLWKKEKKRQVHSGQFDRADKNTFSINNSIPWVPFLQTRVRLSPQVGSLGWFYELFLPLTCLNRWLGQMYSCYSKSEFSAAIASVLKFTWTFRNHSNMLICCTKKHFLLLSMLKMVSHHEQQQ